jgi:hypothetical protein
MHSYRLNFLPVCSILSLSELCSLEPGLKHAFASTNMGPPPPTPLPRVFGKLAVCTLAALSRDVPRHIFFSLLHTLSSRLDGEEGSHLLRTSSLGNVQVLLLLGLSSELHAVTTSRGGSLSWLTVGLALRMAQDIVRMLTRGGQFSVLITRRDFTGISHPTMLRNSRSIGGDAFGPLASLRTVGMLCRLGNLWLLTYSTVTPEDQAFFPMLALRV